MGSELEQNILSAAKGAIAQAIVSQLTGYGSPLDKLVKDVFAHNHAELFALVNGEFAGLLKSDDFRADLKDALNKKLAKTMIDKMGGEIEKRVNELRSDPSTRAKLVIAIEGVIKSLNPHS